MKKLIIASMVVMMMSGCSVVAPKISKAQTEAKQLQELKVHSVQLTRIADALEVIAKNNENI